MGTGDGTGVLSGDGVSSAIGGKTGRRTVTFGTSVTGGCPTGKVIGLGRPITGTGMILSPEFCIVTCEKEITSVVMGGKIIVWLLIVIGSGVIVVDSVSLIGGSSMTQGGLHVTTGDDVSHMFGNAIVERLTLVVRLVLTVVSGTRSSEDEVREVAKTKGGPAVDGVELPFIGMAAVSTLVFVLISELSTAELVRLELTDASDEEPRMTEAVTLLIAVALVIPVGVVTPDGIDVASNAEVTFAGSEATVLFNEGGGEFVMVTGVVIPLLSDNEDEETWKLRLMLAVDKALVMVNGVLETKEAVPFCDLQSGMSVFIGSKVEEVEPVELPRGIENPVEIGFVPIDVELFELISSLLILEVDAKTTGKLIAELEIVVLFSCEIDVVGRPDLEASAIASELFCPRILGLSSPASAEETTVDVISVLRLDNRRLVGIV
jgi:hypothetical protein